MDIMEIEHKIVIELLCLKCIKLTFIFICLIISHQYHHSKPDYACYQMEYDTEYHLNYTLTSHTKWSFDGISIMDMLIDIQTIIKVSFVKWVKFTYIFIYMFLHYQYHYNKPDYTCYQMKY